MKKGKKALALTLALAMSATCFTACGGSDDGTGAETTTTPPQATVPVDTEIAKPEQVDNNSDAQKIELKVWAPTEEQKILKELCETFDGAHPEYDITFTYEEISEPDAYTNVSKDVDTAADVFYFANDQLSNLVEGGYIMELPSKIQEQANADLDDNAIASCTKEGKLYCLPFTANLWYLFYNKEMAEKYNIDMTKLEAIIAADIPGCDYNFSIPLNNGWYDCGFYLGGGCTLFGPNNDDPTQCDWASDRGVAITNYLNNMVASGKFYKDNGKADTIGLLESGKCFSFCTGSWNALSVKLALGDKMGACKLPSFTFTLNGTEETHDITPFGDYKSIGVKKTTKEPVAAALLAQFLVGDYAQEVRLKARSISPTFKTIMEMADKYNDPAVSAGVAQTTSVVVRPTISQLAQYWAPAETLGACICSKNEKVTTDDATTKAFIEQIVGMITAQK